jgi:hypothetical protein
MPKTASPNNVINMKESVAGIYEQTERSKNADSGKTAPAPPNAMHTLDSQ